MPEQKAVTMRLKVDLQCCKCYKKVKNVLCKFPQIREQVFDEKNGIVTIKVVCCDPEKLRDKLCCKGGGSIKSIEIVEPPKAELKEPEKRKTDPEPEKEKEPEKSKPTSPPEKKTPPERKPCVPVGICCGPCSEGRPGGPCFEDYGMPAPPPVPKPRQPPCVPVGTCCGPCSEGRPGGPCFEGCGLPEHKAAPPPVPHPCPPPCVPVGTCCGPCSEGHPGGPCYEGYGRPRRISYNGYYGWAVYDSYDGCRPCHVSRCDQYFSDENPQACTLM